MQTWVKRVCPRSFSLLWCLSCKPTCKQPHDIFKVFLNCKILSIHNGCLQWSLLRWSVVSVWSEFLSFYDIFSLLGGGARLDCSYLVIILVCHFPLPYINFLYKVKLWTVHVAGFRFPLKFLSLNEHISFHALWSCINFYDFAHWITLMLPGPNTPFFLVTVIYSF